VTAGRLVFAVVMAVAGGVVMGLSRRESPRWLLGCVLVAFGIGTALKPYW
jgi:hypothetical protein